FHSAAQGAGGVDHDDAQGLAALALHEDARRKHEPRHQDGAEQRAHQERLRAHALEVFPPHDGEQALHAAASPLAVTCCTKMSCRLGSTTSKRLTRMRAAASRRMAWESAPSAILIST